MIVQQLSVFIENKSGRLNEIFDIIGKSNIRILAAMVADTSEYGILRLITTDNESVFSLLKTNRVSVNLSEVFMLINNGQAGEFSKQLRYFAQSGISIEYMYCSSVKENSFLVIRFTNKEGARKVIEDNNIPVISNDELKSL